MELVKIIDTFKGVTHIPDENEKLMKLNDQFVYIAYNVLYGGHFHVADGNKDIYIEDMEFYYHEEEGVLTDPIMYHTNLHSKDRSLPYFKRGVLNLHQSGIDITFEDYDKHEYRASFLIRGYRVGNDGMIPYSTHIYDDLLYNGIPISGDIGITWVEDAIELSELNLYVYSRQNVAMYKTDGTKDDNCQEGDKTFKSGNEYKKCTRPWRFRKYPLTDGNATDRSCFVNDVRKLSWLKEYTYQNGSQTVKIHL